MTLKEFLTRYCSNYQKFILDEQIYTEEGDVKGWVQFDGDFYSNTDKRTTRLDYYPKKENEDLEFESFFKKQKIDSDKVQELLNYRVITVAAVASQLLKITIDNKFELA